MLGSLLSEDIILFSIVIFLGILIRSDFVDDET